MTCKEEFVHRGLVKPRHVSVTLKWTNSSFFILTGREKGDLYVKAKAKKLEEV